MIHSNSSFVFYVSFCFLASTHSQVDAGWGGFEGQSCRERTSSHLIFIALSCENKHPKKTSNVHINLMSAFQAERVWVNRGSKAVLKNVNLKVPKGHLHMLLGRNGSGKSTFLESLAGLLPVTRCVYALKNETKRNETRAQRNLCLSPKV